MFCKTVTDRVIQGIQPVIIEVNGQDEMAIEVGDEYVLLEREWAQRVMELDKQALKILRKKDIDLPKLMRADVQFGARFCDNRLVKEKKPTPEEKKIPALVLVQIPPGVDVDGSVAYTAAVRGEAEEDGRIKRPYKELEEAKGIRIVMKSKYQVLLTMSVAGASFRAQRLGELGNKPPYYFINWEPPRLYLNAPKRFRNLEQEAA